MIYIALSIYIFGLVATYVLIRVADPDPDKLDDLSVAIFWPLVAPALLLFELLPKFIIFVGDLIVNEIKQGDD